MNSPPMNRGTPIQSGKHLVALGSLLRVVSQCLTSYRDPIVGSTCSPKVYSWIELFAGCANATRAAVMAGHTAAALDLSYGIKYTRSRSDGKTKHNPMDIQEPAGMAFSA